MNEELEQLAECLEETARNLRRAAAGDRNAAKEVGKHIDRYWYGLVFAPRRIQSILAEAYGDDWRD